MNIRHGLYNMKNREGIAMKPRELVQALRALGLTQKQIEARTGIPQPTVSKIGLGRVRDVMSRHYLALLLVYEQEMTGQHSVVWTARDGAEAVSACAADRPDLILMDLIMPVMDGVEATRRIMAATPCAILVVTATVDGNSGRVFDALSIQPSSQPTSVPKAEK
eukprot:gene6160-biopygen5493